MPTLAVLGAGPGLGMSIAHRFGREGYAVALASRTDRRHAGYLSALAAAGIAAEAHAVDVRDRDRLLAVLDAIADRHGGIDAVYHGPAPAMDMRPITETTAADVEQAMTWLSPPVDVVARVLPGMLARGEGGLLFAGGLSAVRPIPQLGALALLSAALRNYALTLHAALAGTGVYAGTLTIGGLIERGDIHRMVASRPDRFGDVSGRTLDPDALADAAWDLYTRRDRPEALLDVPT